MPGTLYIVATPIGHLGELSPRALETLKSVHVIACEDTRRTETLLRAFDFQKELWRYDEHTHGKASGRIREALKQGRSVALVTDAGTPGISDPGGRLVEEAVRDGIQVVPVAGPSAVSAALSAAGLPGEGYVFLGFLPRKKGPAGRVLREALGLGKRLVFFESPFRIEETLEWVSDVCPDQPIVVGRELTKMHEEFIRGKGKDVLADLKRSPRKGEFVVIVGTQPKDRKSTQNPENEP